MKTSKIQFLLIVVAVISLLGACHPDSSTPQAVNRTIVYAVQNDDIYAGSMSPAVNVGLHTDDEWDALLDDFCDYVQQGNTVTFYNKANAQFLKSQTLKQRKAGAKDSHTIKTSSREEMKEWCKSMEAQGLKVVMDYDKTTGMWSGYAYALPPSELGQTLTYVCDFSKGGDVYRVLLTADPVTGRLYVSGSDGVDNIAAINTASIIYNCYNPLDSAQQAVDNASYLYMKSVFDDKAGMHYRVDGMPAFNFENEAFSLLNLDNHSGYYNFSFSSTTQYDTWVCEEDGVNIVMHVDRNTIDPESYSFAGQLAMRLQLEVEGSPFVLSLCGNITSGGGIENTVVGCNEDVVIIGLPGDQDAISVERVSDDMVIWYIGDQRLVFNRI